MNRREFFRAAPAISAVPLLAVAWVKDAKPVFVEQKILRYVHAHPDADFSEASLDEAIAAIINNAKTMPEAYRLSCDMWDYPYAKRLAAEKREHGFNIEVLKPAGSQNFWTLEAKGIMYWSRGA